MLAHNLTDKQINLTDKQIKQLYWDKLHILDTIEGLALGMLASNLADKQIDERYKK
jgi:hypothetical protein